MRTSLRPPNGTVRPSLWLMCTLTCLLLIVPGCGIDESSVSDDVSAGDDDAAEITETPWYTEPGELALLGEALDIFFADGSGIYEADDEPFWTLGLILDGHSPELLTWRALHEDGLWTEGGAVEITWSEGEAHVGRIDFDRPAVAVELARNGARIDYVRMEQITEPPAMDVPLARDLPLEDEVDDGMLQKGALPSWIRTRSQWGARNTGLCGGLHTTRRMTIHHTATPNNDSISTPARMRQMQSYHIDALRWCDYGYHFTVGIDGNIYQGRATDRRIGTHVGGHNTGNVGVSVIGNFSSFSPRQSQLTALSQIASWLAQRHNIPATVDAVRGHRDWPGHASNACPGDRLYAQLPWLRQQIAGGGPPACQSECTAGARRCVAAGAQTCADSNGDGCTTWGTAQACGCGEDCEGGICVRDPDVCCPAAVSGADGLFADIPAGSWMGPVAERLSELSITTGCQAEPRLFCPTCPTPRDQGASLLARALELDLSSPPATPTFDDVAPGSTHYAAIEALYAEGITSGCATDPLRFCPEGLLNRAQAVSLLVAAADLDTEPLATPIFEDVESGYWARADIEALHQACHIDGCSTEPRRFCPTRNVTRAEFGLMLLRVLELDETQQGTCCRPQVLASPDATFSDMPAGAPESDAAAALFDANITSGCSADPAYFCGSCGITREAASALIVRSAGYDLVTPEAPSFGDVATDHRFFSEIETLFANGGISGCQAEPRLFCPNNDLTRAQGAIIIARTMDLEEPESWQSPYDDVDESSWFGWEVTALTDACIVEGCDDDNFCGNEPLTRSDFGLMLARAFQIGDFDNCIPQELPIADESGDDGGAGDDGSAGDDGGGAGDSAAADGNGDDSSADDSGAADAPMDGLTPVPDSSDGAPDVDLGDGAMDAPGAADAAVDGATVDGSADGPAQSSDSGCAVARGSDSLPSPLLALLLLGLILRRRERQPAA